MQKNENRPGYKNTKVGWIPEGWEIKPLGNITTYTNGKAHEGSIDSNGQYIVVNSKFISTNGFVKKWSNDCLLPAKQGDVLMVMSDVPNGRAIARCFLVEENNLYTVNQRICRLHPTNVNSTFLCYKLDRNSYYLAFDDGAKQTNLRKDDVTSCPVPLPPLPEQEGIAGVLECWDKAIRTLEKKIEKKRLIKKGLMQKLLSGKTRLPSFSKVWKTSNFLEAFEIQKGIKTFQVKTAEYMESGKHPIVDQGQKRIVAHTDIEKVYSDLPVIIFGDHTRIVKWIDFPFVIGADGTQLIKNKNGVDLRFGFFLISNLELTALGYSRHLKLLKEANLNLPPLEEQRAIAEVLSAADGEIEAMEKKLVLWKDQKKYLLNNLVTGTIRLPGFCKGDIDVAQTGENDE